VLARDGDAIRRDCHRPGVTKSKLAAADQATTAKLEITGRDTDRAAITGRLRESLAAHAG
jgi:hypothetical protein